MPGAHDAFQSLGPTNWEAFAQQDSKALIKEIFDDAQCLINSIPFSPKTEAGGMRTNTESSDRANELRKDWKEVKVNPRDNPLGLSVYKLAAKDGKGAWFARSSVHDRTSFRKWKIGMEREFAESLKVQGQPGDGKIRGLGADKCVVDQTMNGYGKMRVYQLSAQFPGPTTPRDFVTLCLSSDNILATPVSNGTEKPRSFMLVSKPCVHPECPERHGFIRGHYESVEFIREITTKSSADTTTNGPDAADERIRIPKSADHDKDGELGGENHESHEDDDSAIEWTMITRSDPGGSVPRFIIDKKTPEGIVTDANKFLQWVSSARFEMLLNKNFESTQTQTGIDRTLSAAPMSGATNTTINSSSISNLPNNSHGNLGSQVVEKNNAESPGPGGVYGMISGALGMVASVAASRFLGPNGEDESDTETLSSEICDDMSSIHSFHSFDGAGNDEPVANLTEIKEPIPSPSTGAGEDSPYVAEAVSVHSSHHDKELRKLEERRRKTEEKLQRARERALTKKSDDAQRDELALQKLREKHERDMKKQEEKYQRVLQKLETKRANEEKKAEERRRKQAEREQKANLALELDKVRTERDIARKEIEILSRQVGELQALNTKLVARLGREGISLDEDLTPGSGSGGGLTPATPSGSMSGHDLEKQETNGVIKS